MKIKIGNTLFNNKKSAKEYIQKILYKYKIGDYIFGGDETFLKTLILFHPDAKQKIGCGIKCFSIGKDHAWGKTRCFVLHRTDGNSTEFSFYSCIDGNNRKKDILVACREAISDQIISFKLAAFTQGPVVCPITNITLDKDNCHVDHKPPLTFNSLFLEWLKESNISLDDIKISPPADNQYQTTMIDAKQKKTWQDYHKNNAILRVISIRANLSNVKTKNNT